MALNYPVRIAIAGAAGRTGYSLVFRIANGGLFGHDRSVALSLLDLPAAAGRLEACALELTDCAFPLLATLHVSTDPVQAFRDADWVILLGGQPVHVKPTHRLDLLKENAPVMIGHARAINHVAPMARVLVVTSPCNTNCLVAMTHAHDVPKDHWFALNQHIRMRAIAMVAAKTGAPVTQVTRLTVWGNNSETAYVDLQNARVGNKPALQVISEPDWYWKVLEPTISGRFHKALRIGGATPAGSAAQAIMMTIRAITTPTPFEHWLGAGVLSDGSYGVPRGLVFGFPLITSDGKSWSVAQGLYLDAHAHERIAQNIAELEHEASAVSHLLGRT
ncbi:MAG TPA: malate dehydrogenase [Isosphaeraceae bacterium]|nr:malate dehydrogenase [Isosphaeraceae bacterium]